MRKPEALSTHSVHTLKMSKYVVKNKAWIDVTGFKVGGMEGTWGLLMTNHKIQDNSFVSEGIVFKALSN